MSRRRDRHRTAEQGKLMVVSRTNVEVSRHLPAALQQKVLQLAHNCKAYDGVAPLDEQNRIALKQAASHRRHIFVAEGEELLGYTQATREADTCHVAVMVSPQSRRQGIAGEMLRRVRADAPLWPSGPEGVVDSSAAVAISGWAHGKLPSAVKLAQSLGAEPTRELLKMQLKTLTPPTAEVPEGVVITTFNPAVDIPELLSVNAAAFCEHPEQGSWSLADIEARMAEDWFSANDVFLARESTSHDLLGFHWTKIITEADGTKDGEVYVIGVSPKAQGRHIGSALLDVGLTHLHNQQAMPISLYVEADNTAAVRLYEMKMFTRSESHVVFRSEAPEHPMTGMIPVITPNIPNP